MPRVKAWPDRCSDYDPTETPEGELSRPDRPALAGLEGRVKTWVAGVQAQRERIPEGFEETHPNDGPILCCTETWRKPAADGFQRCRFRLLKAEDTPSPPHTSPPPKPIKKVKVTTLRRVRDTAMTRRIKELYKHTCQICGVRLTLPGGHG